jgi:HEAT repeat protein
MKRRLLFAAVFLALMAVLAWCLLTPAPEPRYQSQPLSAWLLGYAWTSGSPIPSNPGTPKYGFTAHRFIYTDWDQSDAAIRAIGTNAIPTLLQMLCARDTKMKIALINLLQKQHVMAITHTPAGAQNFAAAMGFRKLGPQGVSAIPDLIKIYHRNISPWSRSATGTALYDLAPFGIPQIAQGMTSPDPQVRRMLIGALANIRAQPVALVPVLAKSLHDSDADVRITAAGALAAFGPDAGSAVPDLQQLRQDQNSEARFAAQYALDRVAPTNALK